MTMTGTIVLIDAPLQYLNSCLPKKKLELKREEWTKTFPVSFIFDAIEDDEERKNKQTNQHNL